ncbi:STM2901 family protein [Candidatus Thiosymbion oneisti]|uniref:STM2901 family protein n=1 Tax=Candidatus Thiosymbion oneisti TaxID=589554 RepID=UPI001C40370A|nr:hypothetical protein [Candidatus Thiosymbion oneisti]
MKKGGLINDGKNLLLQWAWWPYAEELYFLIVVDKTLEQLGVQDVIAAALIISGQPILPTCVKIGGPTVTRGTSPTSKYASKILPHTSPLRLPTVTGRNIRTLKITFTRNIGRFIGRTVPVVGWVILASDVVQIFWKAMRTYNEIVDNEDKFFG